VATRKSKRPKVVVGFAAETEKIIAHAKAKLTKKACDLIVANDVSAENGIFGGDTNTVHLISATGVETWPRLSKSEVAARLMQTIATLIDP
jgi:phosphopantothenoylcysteine decarboxylase/phosphopantothenate--cysteine ligase